MAGLSDLVDGYSLCTSLEPKKEIEELAILHIDEENAHNSKDDALLDNIFELREQNEFKMAQEENCLVLNEETIAKEHSTPAIQQTESRGFMDLKSNIIKNSYKNGDLKMSNNLKGIFTCHTSSVEQVYCLWNKSKYCCCNTETNRDARLTSEDEPFDDCLNYLECSDVMTDYTNEVWQHALLVDDPVFLLENYQADELNETKVSQDCLNGCDPFHCGVSCVKEVSDDTLPMEVFTDLPDSHSQSSEEVVKKDLSRDCLKAFQPEMVITVEHKQDEMPRVKSKERCKLALAAAAIQNDQAGIEEENKENSRRGDVSTSSKASNINAFNKLFPTNGIDQKDLNLRTDESIENPRIHVCSQDIRESGVPISQEDKPALLDEETHGVRTDQCQKDRLNNTHNKLSNEEIKGLIEEGAPECPEQMDTKYKCAMESEGRICKENKDFSGNTTLTEIVHPMPDGFCCKTIDQCIEPGQSQEKGICTNKKKIEQISILEDENKQKSDNSAATLSESDKEKGDIISCFTEMAQSKNDNSAKLMIVCPAHKMKHKKKHNCLKNAEDSFSKNKEREGFHKNSMDLSPTAGKGKTHETIENIPCATTLLGNKCPEGKITRSEKPKESVDCRLVELQKMLNTGSVDNTSTLNNGCGQVIQDNSVDTTEIPTNLHVLKDNVICLGTDEQAERLDLDSGSVLVDRTINTSQCKSNRKETHLSKTDSQTKKKPRNSSSWNNSCILNRDVDHVNGNKTLKCNPNHSPKTQLNKCFEQRELFSPKELNAKASVSGSLASNSAGVDGTCSPNTKDYILSAPEFILVCKVSDTVSGTGDLANLDPQYSTNVASVTDNKISTHGTENKVAKKKLKAQEKGLSKNSKCIERQSSLVVTELLPGGEEQRDKKESATASINDNKKAPQLICTIHAEVFPDSSGNLKLHCCFGEIHADSTVTWTKDSKLLARIHRSANDDSPVSLAISQTSQRDQGLYQCSLKNVYGKASAEFQLTSEVLEQLSRSQDIEGGEEIEFNQLLFREDFITDMYFGGNLQGKIVTEDLHFGEGVHRKAFRSKVMCGLLPVFNPGHLCVLKVHNAIAYGTKTNDELVQRNYKLAVQECYVQNTAREYAKIYAAEAEQLEEFGKVPEIIPIFLIHRPANNIPYATVEEELIGDFVKYSVRDGKEINVLRRDSEAGQKCCTFQHWVYEKTNGNLLVTDMQGVGMKLTDVGIATIAKGYKGFKGNCSGSFIDQFKALHLCNKYCEILGLCSLKVSQKQKKPAQVKEKSQPNPPSSKKSKHGTKAKTKM
ncbi:alpha-protein kinase 2 [Pelobates fuscus]|uniref:alpha-protein kinase 2 n=1 Tax=Pelobates fuscus TaxID=191477 RepID=UPI002FE460D0